jgi:hypothetical protein
MTRGKTPRRGASLLITELAPNVPWPLISSDPTPGSGRGLGERAAIGRPPLRI